MKEQQRHIKGLISETLALLCKSGLTFKENCKIEALIGITLDDDDVFLVNIKQRLGDQDGAISDVTKSAMEDSEIAASDSENETPSKKRKKNRKRKRKRSNRVGDGPDQGGKQRKEDDGHVSSDVAEDVDEYGTLDNGSDDDNDDTMENELDTSEQHPLITEIKTEPLDTSGLVILKQERMSPITTQATDLGNQEDQNSLLVVQPEGDTDGPLPADEALNDPETAQKATKTKETPKSTTKPTWSQRSLRKRKPKPNKKFTDEDDLRIAAIAVAKGGKELHSVAKTYGVKAKDILQTIREKNLKKKREGIWKSFSDKDMERAVKDVQENGLNTREAAEKYGLSPSTIQMYLDIAKCRSDYTDEDLVCAVVATMRNEMGDKRAGILYGIQRNRLRALMNRFAKHRGFGALETQGSLHEDDELNVVSEEKQRHAIERVRKWRWQQAERNRTGYINYLEEHMMNDGHALKLIELSNCGVDYSEMAMLRGMREVMIREASVEDACIKYNVPLTALEHRVSNFNWRERHYLDEKFPTKLSSRNFYSVSIPIEVKDIKFRTVAEFDKVLKDRLDEKRRNPPPPIPRAPRKVSEAKKKTSVLSSAQSLTVHTCAENLKFIVCPDGTVTTASTIPPNSIRLPPGAIPGNVISVGNTVPPNAIPVPIMLNPQQASTVPVQVPSVAPVSLLKNSPIILQAVNSSQPVASSSIVLAANPPASTRAANIPKSVAKPAPPVSAAETGSFIDAETLKKSLMKPAAQVLSSLAAPTPVTSLKKNAAPARLSFMPNSDQFRQINNQSSDSPVLINVNGSLYMVKQNSSTNTVSTTFARATGVPMVISTTANTSSQ